MSGAISASTCWTSRWAIELCGYTPEQLREYSHYPEKHFGQPHFLACYTDGPALLAVNKLRTVCGRPSWPPTPPSATRTAT